MKNYTAVQHTHKKKKVVRKKKLGNGEKKVFIPPTRSLLITNIPNHDVVRNGRSPPYTSVYCLRVMGVSASTLWNV